MKKIGRLKRVISLVVVLTIIMGMIPTSVFATTQENNTVVGDDNIPKNNVRLLFSDKYLNGTEGITSYKLELSKYLNSDGVEIQEMINGMYGNLLYATCYSNDIQDGDYLYSYFKDCRTGNIIYAHEGIWRYDIEIKAIRYSDNYSSKELSDLISIRDEDGKYDIINTITCQYYDYNLKEEISELVNGYAIIYNGTAYGLMCADGKLVYDFEYDQIRQDKTNKYIAAWIYSPETVTVFNTETREELSFDEFREFTFTENGFIIGHLKEEFKQHHADKSYREDYPGFGIKIFDADFNLVSNECYKSYSKFGDSLLCSKPSDLVSHTSIGYKDEYNYDLITSDGNIIDLASKFNTQAVRLEINGSSVKVTAYSAKYYVRLYYDLSLIDGYVDLEVGFSGLLDTKGNIITDFTEEAIVEPYAMVWRDGEEVPLTVTVNGVPYELQTIKKNVVFGELNGAFYFCERNYGEDSVTYSYSVFDHYGNKISTLSGESDSERGLLFYNGKQMLFGDYYYDIQTRKKFELSSIIGEYTRIVERTDSYLILRTQEGKNYALYFPETNAFISGFTDYDDSLYDYKTTDFLHVESETGSYLYHKGGRLVQNISSNDDIIVLDNGNIIVTDSNSSYSLYSYVTGEKLDGSTNLYVKYFADDAGNRIIRSSDGKYGLLSANGNIIIEPTYTSQIEYKNFGIYKISRALVDMYGNVILYGEDDSSMYRQNVINWYYNLSNNGTILARESRLYGEEDSYVVFLLDEIIRNQNTKEQTDNMSVSLNKDIVALGETTIAFVTDAFGKLYEYDGNYTVSCTDSTIVDIKTQGTGIVSATITGKVIGGAVLTFTFDDGTEVSGKITVDLSTENILEHFPQVVNNNKYTKIFGEAINNCHQTINTYSDFDAAIISYFTCLKSGGVDVISRRILGKIGLVPDQRDEYVDAAVRALMNEICNYDSTFEDSLNTYLGKWSTAKSHYKATNESLKEFAKYASSISNFSESDILVCASEITSAYGKTVDVAGDAIDIYEILAVIICTESLHIDIVNELLDVVSPDSDLYEGLERLKVDLSSGLVEKVVKEYIQGKLVEKIAKGIQSAANNYAAKKLLGIKSISKLTIALSKICIELIVDEYSDAGGIMASDLTKAIYLTTFASQLEYVLKDEQLKYALGTVEDPGKLKRLYNAYTASICVALESCASICKSEYSYLKDEALKFKNLIAHRCTFEMFMDACKKEAIKQYPTEYTVSINDADQLVVTGTYQPMRRTFSLRSSENAMQNDILYIPSVIDGKKVVSIEANAFRNNEAIKGVIIADGINIIGDYAFAGCVNLEYVIMGSVSEVGEGAFSDCCNLEFVTLPENLLEIKQYTFQNCSELKSVTIPESVLTISDDAFLNTSVTDLIIRSKETNISLNSGLTPSSIFGVQNDSANALAAQLGISVSLMGEIAESISVFKAPENTSYICGEKIDTAGLVLLVNYADRTEYIETDYAVDYSDAPGNQMVNIYYAGRQTSFEVYFQPISIERIDITSLKTTLAIGENTELDVAILPNNAAMNQLLWSSSDEDILIVKDGLVIANSVGEATITVCDTSTGVTGDLTIKVIDNEEVVFEEDQLTKLVYKKIIHSGNYLFSCSQSSYSISVYDMDMHLIGRGYESVQLYLDKDVVIVVNRYINSNPDKTTLYTTKYATATDIEISHGETITGYKGAKHTLSVRFHPDNSIEETIDWASSDPSVATVDDSGEVSFASTGRVIITATTDSGLSDSIVITVIECPKILLDEDVTLNTSTNTGAALFEFVPEEDGIYCFYSYNNDFDTYGYVLDAEMNEIMHDDDSGEGNNFSIQYGLNAGQTYYLKARPQSTSNTGTYCIKVIHLVPASSISINIGDTYSAFVRTHLLLSVEFAPQNSIVEGVTWTSSDPSVATVDEYGNVWLLMAGTTTITATSDNGLTTTCTITVEDYPTIIENEDVTVDLNQDDPYAYFYFTPEEDGYYVFYSESDNDTYGYIFDAELNQFNSDDDSGDGSNFRVGYQMEAGTTYILQARFYSKSTNGSFNVIIEKSKFITNLEITSLPTKMEYIKGFVDLKYDGLQLKATWSDGTTTDWVMNVDDYYIGDQRVHIYDYDADVNGNITISCGGKEVSYTLTLVDNPVDHLEVVSGTSFKCIENYNGCIDENDDGEYFHYYVKYPSDAVIRIVYKDGTSVTANVGSYVEDFYVSWNSNQYNEPWVVGSENKSIITYLGHSVYLPITVEKNWVESIEVVSGKVTCIENAYGHEISNGFLYYYDMPDDVTLKVNYLDGSSKVVDIKDKVDGYSFDFYEDQYSKPWVLGEDNYITLSYLGAETQLPVSVIANPVERIEINTAPTREYIYGDIKYGEFDGNSYGLFYPSDLTGLSFTVYYTDGSNKTFSYEDIDEDGKINGYGYYLNRDDSVPTIGDFPMQFEYMGRTAEYTVVLKETNVSSISVTKVPDKNRFDEPNYVGMEIAISYKDGTSKTVTVTDDNLSYEYNYIWGEFYHYVTIDDSALRIVKHGYDNPYWYAVYLGATCEIRDLSFEDSKDINSIELKIDSWIGYGMIAEVKYADGTTETLTIEMLDYFFSSYESIADCYGKTEDGIIHYTIKVFTDQDGNEIRYEVSLLGETINVEAKKVLYGDVTGDGVVNNKDVTLLRRYLIGGWNVTIDSDAADVNKDGDINNKDVTLLRRYLIGGWNVTLG